MLVRELHSRVDFPVFQDTADRNIWSLLDGNKDDFFIYDRCGNLAYHLPYPNSWLGYRFFQESLLSAYNNDPCNCAGASAAPVQGDMEGPDNGESNTDVEPAVDISDRMMGDSPNVYPDTKQEKREKKMQRILYNKTIRKNRNRKLNKKHHKLHHRDHHGTDRHHNIKPKPIQHHKHHKHHTSSHTKRVLNE